MRTITGMRYLRNTALFLELIISPLQFPMAKSLRSKTKRAFRAKKREEGVFAAAHAARLQRLHAKIGAIVAAPRPTHDEILQDAENAEGGEEVRGEEMAGGYQPAFYSSLIHTHVPNFR